MAVWVLDLALFSDLAVPERAVATVPLVGGALPVLGLLLLRRRHPVAVALLVSACVVPALLLLAWPPVLTVALAVSTAAARASLRASVLCLVAALTAHGFALVEEVRRNPQLDAAGALAGVGAVYVVLEAGAWGAGRWSAANRRRAARLERAREQALADERARIARELHDIVAHAVTVMLLHAAVGRRAVEQRSPAEAGEAFGVIEEVGGRAVNELRRMLGLLRTDAADVAAEPLPTVDGIARLVEDVRRAGVDVDLRTTGEARPLDPSVGLAAFRAVQEALTNTVRHAGAGARAAVDVTWSAGSLAVRVVDDGGGRADPRLAALSTGTGLVGLAERVTVAGGRLRHGARAEGGWYLEAVLPVTGATPPAPPAHAAAPAPGRDRTW
ncbi:sensor histidine kinase [Cellulomonas sp. NPDC057328]|uniref:sensor histidine kinase n=1 Tax=Cellulomonas sp. NPDC057328 TaxID=3346101 RepID=UPI0036265624